MIKLINNDTQKYTYLQHYLQKEEGTFADLKCEWGQHTELYFPIDDAVS